MRRVLRRARSIGIIVALTLGWGAGAAARADVPTLDATVAATPTGTPMPAGFVGISVETQAVHRYTGRDPRAVNPVFVQLLRALAPGQSPVLRIGGDSTDHTWWPVRGVIPPGGVTYALTNGWLRTTQALAAATGARLIVGVNLAGDRPALAVTEAQAILRGIGRRYIDALEIGNEPDLYGRFPWFRDRQGHVVFARSRHYSLGSFITDFLHWQAALPKVPLVGPSFSGLGWMKGLSRFLSKEPAVRIATVHRYPLRGCITDPARPGFASIPNLLADSSAAGLAEGFAPYVRIAHTRGLPFRVSEMNSASCTGTAGVSDTFASALWILDTLFELRSVGVDGVNVHTLPGAPYAPFTFTHASSGWVGVVHPVYYGMLMFAQAFPPGAALLPVSAPAGPVKVWATLTPAGRLHVVLINKDPANSVTVALRLPGTARPASISRLLAPSLSSTSGVTLAGQSFDPATSTGTLAGADSTTSLIPTSGTYSVTLPAASAVTLAR